MPGCRVRASPYAATATGLSWRPTKRRCSPSGAGEASIGRSLAVRSIRAAGLELAASPVGRDDLPRMDELFFIDHRGVTALSRCDGQPYMAIFAERIAGALRGLFPNM